MPRHSHPPWFYHPNIGEAAFSSFPWLPPPPPYVQIFSFLQYLQHKSKGQNTRTSQPSVLSCFKLVIPPPYQNFKETCTVSNPVSNSVKAMSSFDSLRGSNPQVSRTSATGLWHTHTHTHTHIHTHTHKASLKHSSHIYTTTGMKNDFYSGDRMRVFGSDSSPHSMATKILCLQTSFNNY
jgi:hypothetical protein